MPIPDKLWDEFVAWWKSKWLMTSPDRNSIEIFQEWQSAKFKNIDWKWSFEKEKNNEK